MPRINPRVYDPETWDDEDHEFETEARDRRLRRIHEQQDRAHEQQRKATFNKRHQGEQE